ncbi:DNA mismatch repair protein Mlh1 isoform X2 [Ctenocephalides felis]|uniref:DNA mismatch repair protein Mlh1 isoform X2 n=1 Tax=Ctenocephalides felis TaxID=7515 RepID=UPI000E6E2CA5|nr:DNA mismatch repair protein Mlh1 isoform X2 [Ctenocephalides felis]
MSLPLEIRRLDEAVINRIAAGEIIQRPANALKELLENSLDAKSSSIQISVKSGGLKYLQIQDNGTGIRKEDLAIVCERFTTSKLQKFEDLQSIATYGFRGEALASISHIARLSIQTKTADSVCAFKASYEDGKLKSSPKPCAGNQGTQITVEDLFHNITNRLQTLKSPAEEYQKICDVVTRYAIHNSKIGFALKKVGESNDIKTPVNSNCVDNIRCLFGQQIASHLLFMETEDKTLGFKAQGYVTNVNYSAKKGIFILFINHRLVDSSLLRKCLTQIYSVYLPKNMHSFVYLSLEINPEFVDVNVHPTKHEVHFMNEEEIVEKIKTVVETKLLDCNSSRIFYTQARLPGNISPPKLDVSKSKPIKEYDKDMVRKDFADQTIHKYFGNTFRNKQTGGERTETKLTSVLNLRKGIENDCHTNLREILSTLIFVANVNWQQSLIQHQTKLYICNTQKLCESLIYEMILYDFGNLGMLSLTNSVSIKELALLALDSPECGWTEEDGDKQDLASKVEYLLTEKSPMLSEYFSLTIENGHIKTLPMILENFIPEIGQLPMYILRLATEVDWDTEKECFVTFCEETARYYASSLQYFSEETRNWVIEHVIFPAIRKFYLPPKKFAENGAILQIANLPDLYKVFERC